MTSVAAELAEMHPQTLPIYESKGLINPKRSPKNTRLYSQRDVKRLRRIQQMTNDEGLNLAGVETVLEMEERVDEMRAELEALRSHALELEQRMGEEVERVRRELRAEIVPYGAYDPQIENPADGQPPVPRGPVNIPVQRPHQPGRQD